MSKCQDRQVSFFEMSLKCRLGKICFVRLLANNNTEIAFKIKTLRYVQVVVLAWALEKMRIQTPHALILFHRLNSPVAFTHHGVAKYSLQYNIDSVGGPSIFKRRVSYNQARGDLQFQTKRKNFQVVCL